MVVLKGEKADVQMHDSKPAFYLRLDDEQLGEGIALTVDTHGASTAAGKGKVAVHEYAIVRVDVRQDARVVPSFEIAALGTDKRQQDVFETTGTVLPGGHWLKLVPEEGAVDRRICARRGAGREGDQHGCVGFWRASDSA